MQFNTWIQERHKGIAGSGYLTSVDDAARLEVTLLWHGKATPLLRAIIAAGERRGISVRVEYRKYGLPQLERAIRFAFRDAALIPGFRVYAIAGLAANYDGINIMASTMASKRRESAREVAMVSTLPALITGETGVAVKITPGHPVISQVLRLTKQQAGEVSMMAPASRPSGTRDQDHSPFSAGGLMRSRVFGVACSSGFGISVNGIHRVLTARHCVENPPPLSNVNDYAAIDYRADNYGAVVAIGSNSGMDARLKSKGFGAMFDGPYSTKKTRHIHGYLDVDLGDTVCTSGGNSGTHCNIKIDNMMFSFNDGFGPAENAIHAHQIHGNISSVQGDSGGAVFKADGTHWWAVGMIQAGNSSVPCSGLRIKMNVICSPTTIFTEIHTILKGIRGSSLLTS